MNFLNGLKRIWVDLFLGIFIFIFYLSGAYENFAPPLQLISLKLVLVSMGFLHAHAIGKACFPKVDWKGEFTPSHVVRLFLYVVVIYAYSQGG
ncbi:MAG: hypothetical protein RBT49_04535 [Bacteroidales bacterium]|jgi:hypothetical protein|nr:hypothetical protein [Bacteroidales bacterium]